MIDDRNVITPEGHKLYLATLEFVHGEKRRIFRKGFYAENQERLRDIINEYLAEYYGFENGVEMKRTVSSYRDNEISVNLKGCEEITSYGQLVL